MSREELENTYTLLTELNLIAQGGEADLYAIDEEKILRVARGSAQNSFETEKVVFPILAEHHILVPEIYSFIQIENRPAEVMERINGETLLSHILSSPFSAGSKIKEFAKLHQQILAIHEKESLCPIERIFEDFTGRPRKIETETFNFVLGLLQELPKGDSVCHGDFHPGNILIQNDRNYVIDWSGAHVGNPLSDIAHTYLLMTHVPKTPGQSKLQHKIVKLAGRYIAKLYLREIHKLVKFDYEEFDNWLIVMSLFRLYCGLPSEQEERKKYLRKAYKKHNQKQ